MLYAAYGSNLDPQQMVTRCPHSPLRITGWLTGWRLTFGGEGWDGALPTLAEDPGSRVFVGLYDVTTADEAALDTWESADSGLYRKIRVRVTTLEGDETAWAYVLTTSRVVCRAPVPSGCSQTRRRSLTHRPTICSNCATDPAPPAGRPDRSGGSDLICRM